MKRYLALSILFFSSLSAETPETHQPTPPKEQEETPSFRSFTGRVAGNRVRMRIKPELSAPVAKELKNGDLFVILGETEDFYSVSPPEGTKLYVHRKFILDNTVEGSRVNVRLEPSTEAPVITQLAIGEKVNGTISEKNNKWFEISPPASAHFYIAKDYIENVGSPALYNELSQKKNQVQKLFAEAKKSIEQELQKPFNQIQIDDALQKLTEISKETTETPKEAEEAKQLLAKTHDAYLQKKINHLEQETERSSTVWIQKTEQLKEEIAEQETNVKHLEARLKGEEPKRPMLAPMVRTNAMLVWEPQEKMLFDSWASEQQAPVTLDDFYKEEETKAKTIRGTVTPYNQALATRPGDYLLLSESTGTPIAYLYSTMVNLSGLSGDARSLRVVERPNNHFAFPAYFVLSVEE